MKKQVLQFGAAIGVAIIIYTFATLLGVGDFSEITVSELRVLEGLGYLRYVILIAGILLGMRAVSKASSERVSYWGAAKTGILIGCIAALFVGAMEWSYLQFFNPDFFDEYTSIYLERLRVDGAAQAEIDSAIAEMEKFSFFRNPLLSGAWYFFETAFIGLVVSLLGAYFFRKEVETV